MNLIDELTVDDYSTVKNIRNEYRNIFNRMKSPSAITINIHPTVRVLDSFKKNTKQKVGLPEINSLWSTLSFEIRKMNYLSFERNKPSVHVLAFGNIDVGDDKGQLHIHGVVNNIHALPEAPFHYLIRTALKQTHAKHRIISGTPDIQRKASVSWVDYVFKNRYLHPLMTK